MHQASSSITGGAKTVFFKQFRSGANRMLGSKPNSGQIKISPIFYDNLSPLSHDLLSVSFDSPLLAYACREA